MKTVSYTRAAARALRKHRSMAPRITAKIQDYAHNPAALANVVTEWSVWIAGGCDWRLSCVVSGDRNGNHCVGYRAAGEYLRLKDTMGKPQIITSPSGEELVVLPRDDYEDLVDALAARKVESALAAGREELLSSQETAALLAAPTPLAFWRNKRGKTISRLAAEAGVAEAFLSDFEVGKVEGDVALYAKLARLLGVSIEDLAPAG